MRNKSCDVIMKVDKNLKQSNPLYRLRGLAIGSKGKFEIGLKLHGSVFFRCSDYV